jgi:hypothetical protein
VNEKGTDSGGYWTFRTPLPGIAIVRTEKRTGVQDILPDFMVKIT